MFDDKWKRLKEWIEEHAHIPVEDILSKMKELETDDIMSAQNLTSMCLQCNIDMGACDCEHKSNYFKWLREKQNKM